MLGCSEVRELLSPMADREVSPEELRAIEEHLRTCKECAFESTMLVGLKRLLHNWEGVRATETFRARVLEKVRSDPTQLPRSSWRTGAALMAGVAVLAAFIARWELMEDGFQPQQSAAAQAQPAEVRPKGQAVEASPAPPSWPAAQLTLTEGAVHILEPGGRSSLGSAGDVLSPGYAIRVAGKGRAELDLLSCLAVRLDGPAQFSFGPALDEGELVEGSAYFKSGKREALYRLKCAGALLQMPTAAVLASVELGPDALRVVVAGGSVEVSSKAGTRELKAGEALELSRNGAPRAGPVEASTEELVRLRRWAKR